MGRALNIPGFIAAGLLPVPAVAGGLALETVGVGVILVVAPPLRPLVTRS